MQNRKTKTDTNPHPDPNRYRRCSPDPNARIQKFIHWMAIATFKIADCHRMHCVKPGFHPNAIACVRCVWMETGLNANACVGKQPIMVATASTEHPIGCKQQPIGCSVEAHTEADDRYTHATTVGASKDRILFADLHIDSPPASAQLSGGTCSPRLQRAHRTRLSLPSISQLIQSESVDVAVQHLVRW